MTPNRWIGVAYVMMVCLVVGVNLPLPQPSAEEQCADFVHHLLAQLEGKGHVLIPHPGVKYRLCVEQMKRHERL